MARNGPRNVIGRLRIRGWLAAAAVVFDLLVLNAQIETAIGSATCMERAKYEMILCVAPPDLWQVLAAAAVAIGLAILIGIDMGHARRSGD